MLIVLSISLQMNAGHLVDEKDYIDGTRQVRLWGTRRKQIDTFGYDVEKQVWELLVKNGCDLAEIIIEWKKRKDVCKRLEEHWDAVFAV